MINEMRKMKTDCKCGKLDVKDKLVHRVNWFSYYPDGMAHVVEN